MSADDKTPPPPPPPPPVPAPRMSIKLKRKPKSEGPAPEITYAGDTGVGVHAALSEIDALIEALGAIFHNTIHQSWLSVSDVDQTLDRTYKVFEKALATHNEITFSVMDGKLKVNKEYHPVEGEAGMTFIEHLTTIDAHSFTIYRGMPRQEFTRFIGLLTLTTDELKEKGGFYDAVNGEKLEFVKAVKVFFQEVTEEETVMSKRELERKLEEERVQAEHDVLAMLQGEEGDEAAMAASAHKLASDSGKMADLIIKQAEKDQSAGGEGDGKSKHVVTCLRRAFNGLMKDPSLKTQKGKKALMKTLRQLEKEIHLQMGDSPDALDKQAVTEAIETMEDELKMDSIANEYTKRLKAIEQSEKRILRFMKAQGLEQIEDSDLSLKLSSAGLDVSGWHALLAKSHATAEDRRNAETEEGAMAAIGNLATLLGQLEGNVKSGEEAGGEAGGEAKKPEETKEQLAEHLAEVDREVKAITAETEHKILDLVSEIHADIKGEASDTKRQLSRRQLLKGLAEIVQELCQPLSVINCSVNMVTSKALGDVPDAQLEMLNMAHDASSRIKQLIDALQEISGMPPELSPDSRLQDALYEQT